MKKCSALEPKQLTFLCFRIKTLKLVTFEIQYPTLWIQLWNSRTTVCTTRK